MIKTLTRVLMFLVILGTTLFLTGCASDFGKACTRFFS